MLCNIKMAQVEFGPDPKFIGTGSVRYTFRIFSNDNMPMYLSKIVNAQVDMDHNANKIHISFVLPKQYMTALSEELSDYVYNGDRLITEDAKFDIVGSLNLSYKIDSLALKHITITRFIIDLGHYVSARDAQWYINGFKCNMDYDPYVSHDVAQLSIENLLVFFSKVVFVLDQKSEDNLGIWLDYIYENMNPDDSK